MLKLCTYNRVITNGTGSVNIDHMMKMCLSWYVVESWLLLKFINTKVIFPGCLFLEHIWQILIKVKNCPYKIKVRVVYWIPRSSATQVIVRSSLTGCSWSTFCHKIIMIWRGVFSRMGFNLKKAPWRLLGGLPWEKFSVSFCIW